MARRAGGNELRGCRQRSFARLRLIGAKTLFRKLAISGLNLEIPQPMPDESASPIAEGKLSMEATAFRAFYEETSPALFAYLLHASGERALAEDLLQDSYCRFLCAKLVPEDGRHRRSYLFRIATNLMRDQWRSKKGKGEVPLSEFFPDTVIAAHDPDLNIHMREALQQLKVRERQLLWLAYVEGASHKEIADSIGLKAASVRALLFRARHKLAGLIGGNERNLDPGEDV
jgi:RNA polymerase sigma-70 factor (ECF subfamily)